MFVGRETELRILKQSITNQEADIAVIYGRRRIGKTELIRQAVSSTTTSGLFIEGVENRPKSEQIQRFCFQIAEIVTTPKKRPKTWAEAFHLLTPSLREKPRILVLDEFQWLANYRKEIVADLKLIWDQYWSQIPGVKLILCGSIASFMKDKVVQSSALYGRARTIIHLKELNLRETQQLLGCQPVKALEAQMLVGGVPQYLALMKPYVAPQQAISELAFSEHGFLKNEFQRIFVSHFGKNPDHEKIIRFLANHPYGVTRKKLQAGAGLSDGGGLTQHLSDLEAAGFISSSTPVNKKRTSTLIRYEITDHYLRFYIAFIEPNLALAESSKNVFEKIAASQSYRTWLGRSFEYVCRNHTAQIAKALGFSAVNYTYGPYFKRSDNDTAGVQIDLLFDRADNVLTICEMKHRKEKTGLSTYKELEKKENILQKKFPQKITHKALITSSGASKELTDHVGHHNIVTLDQLFH